MKETVLLIPGLLCDRSLWRHQLEYMGRDYVLKVADLSIGNSIEEFAENAMALVPDGAFNIAGLSMGGYVALEIYKHAPERVSRLALLNASPYADLAEHAQYRRSSMELAKEHGLGDVVDSLLGRLIHPSRYQEEELVKTIDAMAHRVGVDGYSSANGFVKPAGLHINIANGFLSVVDFGRATRCADTAKNFKGDGAANTRFEIG